MSQDCVLGSSGLTSSSSDVPGQGRACLGTCSPLTLTGHKGGPVKPQTTECEQAPVTRTPGSRCARDYRCLPQQAGSRVTSADHTEQRGMVTPSVLTAHRTKES